MNRIFLALVLLSFSVTAWNQAQWVAPAPVEAIEAPAEPLPADPQLAALTEALRALRAEVKPAAPPAPEASPMDRLSASMFTAAQSSVTLAINLIGAMALFLGLMKVAEEGGLLQIIARTIRPIMVRLFPDVPPDHPAMGAMILNMAANALGLGNAATPFGIRAMQELNKLNPRPGTASNAMVLFLAINTSSVTLLPTGVIAIRQGMGSADPAGILATTLFATVVSTVVAVGGTKLLQRVVPLGEADESVEIAEATAAPLEAPEASEAYPGWVSALAMISIVLFIPAAILWGTLIAPWVVPALAVALLSFGAMRGVKVYESFVEGAKDGFQVAIKIIPYLVAILVAVAMFRASGALDALVSVIDPVTSLINLPGEALPMALLRPLSGSGAYGVMVSIMQSAGPDSYVGYLVSTLQGSTETTFYVLAVYFGAVQVQRTRHALPAALMADTAGVLAAVFICSMLFG